MRAIRRALLAAAFVTLPLAITAAPAAADTSGCGASTHQYDPWAGTYLGVNFESSGTSAIACSGNETLRQDTYLEQYNGSQWDIKASWSQNNNWCDPNYPYNEDCHTQDNNTTADTTNTFWHYWKSFTAYYVDGVYQRTDTSNTILSQRGM